MAKFNSMVFMKSFSKLLKGKHLTEIGYKIATIGVVIVGIGLMKTDKALENADAYTGENNIIDTIGNDVNLASSDPKRFKFGWEIVDTTKNESEK